MPPGGGHDCHGRSRTPHADCRAAGIFSAVSPAMPAPRSGGGPHHAVGRSPRPRRRPSRRSGRPPPRESRTRRPFRTASYSVLLYVYLPTPEPPGPGECAGSARNKPSRELPDLYTRTARKTIVISAPGKWLRLFIFPVVSYPCLHISVLQPSSFPARTLPPRVPARSYGQAGGPREAAGDGQGKAGQKASRRAGKGATADGIGARGCP